MTNHAGFSLIELIIVIMLLGFLAAAVVPSGAIIPEIRLEAAAERTASDIKYAQALSLKEGGHVGLTFAPGSESYTVLRELATPVPDPMNTGQDLALAFGSESRFRGVEIVSVDFAGGTSLQFDNLGSPRDASYAPLAAAGIIVLSTSGLYDTVRIEALTGKVSY